MCLPDKWLSAHCLVSSPLPPSPLEDSEKAAPRGNCEGNIHEDDIKLRRTPK